MLRHIRYLRITVLAVAGLAVAFMLIAQGSVALGSLVAILCVAAVALALMMARQKHERAPARFKGTPKQNAMGAAAAAGLLLLLTAWNYFGHNGDLRTGEVATARGEVVDIDHRRRSADVAVVRFRTSAGAAVEVRTPVDRHPQEGSTVPVEYVPADPEKARIVDNWAPAYERLSLLCAAMLLIAVVAGVVAVVKPRRQRVSST